MENQYQSLTYFPSFKSDGLAPTARAIGPQSSGVLGSEILPSSNLETLLSDIPSMSIKSFCLRFAAAIACLTAASCFSSSSLSVFAFLAVFFVTDFLSVIASKNLWISGLMFGLNESMHTYSVPPRANAGAILQSNGPPPVGATQEKSRPLGGRVRHVNGIGGISHSKFTLTRSNQDKPVALSADCQTLREQRFTWCVLRREPPSP